MRFWVGVVLFFAFGASLGLAVASSLLNQGASVLGAIGLGACIGTYGTWFVFYVCYAALTALQRVRGARRP